jgi:hypothetical protein
VVIALPALAEILFWVGALIFCLLCVYIAKSLFGVAGGTLGKLPVVGGWINSGLTSLEHKIVSTMSGAAASVDSHIGDAFHRLARILDWTGREIKGHADLLALIASYLPGFASLTVLRTLYGDLLRLVHAAQRIGIHALTQTVTIVHTIRRTVVADAFPRIRSAERDIGRILSRDIPRLRAREAELGREVTNLWKWTRSHALVAGSLAFAGAVALALSRLGIGWVRCSKVGRAGKTLCGMDESLLESLLADTLAIVGTVSLIEFIRDAQAVEHVALEALGGFIRELPQV